MMFCIMSLNIMALSITTLCTPIKRGTQYTIKVIECGNLITMLSVVMMNVVAPSFTLSVSFS
jgi:hypothetical protein